MDATEQYRLDERLANTIFYLWEPDEVDGRDIGLRLLDQLVAIEKRSRGAAAPFLRGLYGFLYENFEDTHETLATHDRLMSNLPRAEVGLSGAEMKTANMSVARDAEAEAAVDAEGIAGVVAKADFADWMLDPVAPGDWQPVQDTEAPLLRALAASHLADGLEGVVGARWCRPGFYKDVTLIELQLSSEDTSHIAAFYVTDTETAAFDGNSPVVHELNATGRLVLNEDTAADYLQFFCLVVQGEDGPFRIVVDGPDIPGWDRLDDEIQQTVAENVLPLTVRRDEDNEDAYRVPACVKYGHALFKADFSIQETGMVEMLDDDILVSDIDFSREVFDSRGLRELVHLKS